MIASRLLMLLLATTGFAAVWSGDQREQERLIAMNRGRAAAIAAHRRDREPRPAARAASDAARHRSETKSAAAARLPWRTAARP